MLKKKEPEKFEYCLENVTSDKLFYDQCKSLENGITDLIKEDLIVSDDDSPAQYYSHMGEEIFVLYDIGLEEIYVVAPFDVGEYILHVN